MSGKTFINEFVAVLKIQYFILKSEVNFFLSSSRRFAVRELKRRKKSFSEHFVMPKHNKSKIHE